MTHSLFMNSLVFIHTPIRRGVSMFNHLGKACSLSAIPLRSCFWISLLFLLTACERPTAVQRGYRGTAMLQIYKPAALAATASLHEVPEPEPVDPPNLTDPS